VIKLGIFLSNLNSLMRPYCRYGSWLRLHYLHFYNIFVLLRNLADTQDRGALDSTDFAIGMYLIQGLMSGKLSFVPSSLPPGLYQQAGGTSSSNQGSIRSHATGNSGSFSPLSNSFPQNRVQTQYSDQSQILQPDLTGFSAQNKPAAPRLPMRPNPATFGAGAFGSSPGSAPAPRWDVTAAEKANADRYFDNLDPQRRAFIEGDVAVPFMLESKLPEEELAQVWYVLHIYSLSH
jgi:epidermal growth factor receptor substrate 15